MTSVSVNESLKKCPVCLDFFTNETTAKTNACDHEFCVNCITKWSEHENCCPIDRKKFQKIFTISGSIKIKPKKRKRKNALYDVSVFCEVCKNSRSKTNVVILCDSCDLGYHCECLNPPLKSIPSGQWFCPVCREVTEKLKIKKKIAKGEKKQTKTDSTSLTISQKTANSVCAIEEINKKVINIGNSTKNMKANSTLKITNTEEMIDYSLLCIKNLCNKQNTSSTIHTSDIDNAENEEISSDSCHSTEGPDNEGKISFLKRIHTLQSDTENACVEDFFRIEEEVVLPTYSIAQSLKEIEKYSLHSTKNFCNGENDYLCSKKNILQQDSVKNVSACEVGLTLDNLSKCLAHSYNKSFIKESVIGETNNISMNRNELFLRNSKKVKLSEENNVSCHFEKTVNMEEALSFEPEFEKLDSIFSSKKDSCINVAVNNENENLQNVFDMQSTNMPKLPDVHDAQQKESLLSSKGTDQNNIDCNKNLVNNFRIQEVHSAIKAKLNLPAELKKIEKEKWKAWSPKKKYKSSFSNLLNLGASTSQEHILTKRKNVCDLQNYQIHTIQNTHENDSEIKNILYNNLNPFSQLNNYSEPKKRFKAFQYNIIKSEGQAICYKPKDILCNTFCPSYLEHLEVREDGSLFLNWTKSDS